MNKNHNRERTSHPLPDKIQTAVGAEVHDDERGNIHLCHGYDLYNDLIGNYSWVELTYLHLKGELPSTEIAEAFDLILQSVITPGPKNWATQAAMTAAVTHTPVGNCLLAGLAVLEGRYQGALAIEKTMEMFIEIAEERITSGSKSLSKIIQKYPDKPGFDKPDQVLEKRINSLAEKFFSILRPNNKYMQFALEFARKLNMQLTRQGFFAAALCDLGMSPRQGHGLYLIAAAPGILSHLLEQMEGNWSSYPFGQPPEYVGSKDKQLTDEQISYPKNDE